MTKKDTIVLVDDDAFVTDAFSLILRRFYNVQVVNDPESAIDVCCQDDVKLVLLDIAMPKYDGFWVYEQIRRQRPALPIVFNSAYHDDLSTQSRLNTLRHQGYLQKGMRIDLFLDFVATAMKKT
jgi:CheY-like chemotaxis protein